ncbi:MAG: AAA family ATPase [Chloroflexi bacterium]|nr:AAA family ATPase [Chloroflexota bacterium]
MREKARASALASVTLQRDRVADWDGYPFSVPAIRSLESLAVTRKVCFLAGENGTGKSTLLEAIAVAFGFGMQGGSRHMTHPTGGDDAIAELAQALRVGWRAKPLDGFFLRAETLFRVASYLDELGGDIHESYGGTSLHEQSHGEALLSLVRHRFSGGGFYILDEPESALSPQRQLAFLVLLHELASQGAQFLIATHSPIILAYPDAQIFSFTRGVIEEVTYRETEAYQIASGFLKDPELYLKHLLGT